MEALKRIVFAAPLAVLSVVTSITIVVDASEWYGNLYKDLELFGWVFTGKFRGIAFALILEVFLAVMMATRLPNFQGRYHKGNLVLSLVAVVTVIVIGYGTWQGIVEGNESRFTVSASLQRRIDSTQAALVKTVENKRVFGCRDQEGVPIPDCRQQRGNLAMSINDERRLTERLEGLEDQTGETSATGAFQFWFLAVAKFVMLAANMICLWLIGRVIRGREAKYPDLGTPPRVDAIDQPTQTSRMRFRFQFWTKDDFLYHFKQIKATSKDIMAATGLNDVQLSVIINYTSKVLRFIRSRREHEITKGGKDSDPKMAGQGRDEDGPQAIG